jgi:hypothetical protein
MLSLCVIASASDWAPAFAASRPAGPSARSASRRSLSPAALTRYLLDEVLDVEKQRIQPGVDLTVGLNGGPVVALGVAGVRDGPQQLCGGLLAGDAVALEDVLQAEEVELAGFLRAGGFFSGVFSSSAGSSSKKPVFTRCGRVSSTSLS